MGLSAGWPPTCMFVTVDSARRYLATSIHKLVLLADITFSHYFGRRGGMFLII